MSTVLTGPLPAGGGPVPSSSEEPPSSGDARAELAARVRLQVAFRLLVAVALLAATVAVHVRAGPALLRYDFRVIYGVIAFMVATSVPVLGLVGRMRSVGAVERLSMGHLLADVASNTALIYVTGGTDSPIVFLYGLTI